MSKETGKSTFTLNKEPESELPPCGCTIGDLLKIQTEIDMLPTGDATGDLSIQEPESDVPPCGCAIGDLLEKKVETNSLQSCGTTKD